MKHLLYAKIIFVVRLIKNSVNRLYASELERGSFSPCAQIESFEIRKPFGCKPYNWQEFIYLHDCDVGLVSLDFRVTFSDGKVATCSTKIGVLPSIRIGLEPPDTIIKDIQVGGFSNVVLQEKKSIINPRLKLSEIFPNPFSDYTTVEIESSDQMNIDLVIYNLQGLIIYSSIHQLSRGVNQITISPSESFPSGIYILSISNDEINFQKKLEIIR